MLLPPHKDTSWGEFEQEEQCGDTDNHRTGRGEVSGPGSGGLGGGGGGVGPPVRGCATAVAPFMSESTWPTNGRLETGLV